MALPSRTAIAEAEYLQDPDAALIALDVASTQAQVEADQRSEIWEHEQLLAAAVAAREPLVH